MAFPVATEADASRSSGLAIQHAGDELAGLGTATTIVVTFGGIVAVIHFEPPVQGEADLAGLEQLLPGIFFIPFHFVQGVKKIPGIMCMYVWVSRLGLGIMHRSRRRSTVRFGEE